mmetsp:Transcript_49302/g.110899  ORF Transcript_49302/g.110899 Transcript_49302/m.110899 type:complete len:339 (-) Transcript_49302:742-1758(-)
MGTFTVLLLPTALTHDSYKKYGLRPASAHRHSSEPVRADCPVLCYMCPHPHSYHSHHRHHLLAISYYRQSQTMRPSRKRANPKRQGGSEPMRCEHTNTTPRIERGRAEGVVLVIPYRPSAHTRHETNTHPSDGRPQSFPQIDEDGSAVFSTVIQIKRGETRSYKLHAVALLRSHACPSPSQETGGSHATRYGRRGLDALASHELDTKLLCVSSIARAWGFVGLGVAPDSWRSARCGFVAWPPPGITAFVAIATSAFTTANASSIAASATASAEATTVASTAATIATSASTMVTALCIAATVTSSAAATTFASTPTFASAAGCPALSASTTATASSIAA